MSHYIITEAKDIENLKSNDSFDATCVICGNKYTVKQFHKSRIDSYKRLMCSECSRKNTCMMIYGGISPANNSEIVSKMKTTCISKYGVSSYTETDEFKQKSKCTMNLKYGVDHAQQSEAIRNKSKSIKFERYGDENYNNRDKAKNTCMSIYGVKTPLESKKVQETYVKNFRKNHGVDYPMQDDKIRLKSEKTVECKYGAKNIRNTNHYKQKMISMYGVEHPVIPRYYYNGEYFDSAWELSVWIYFEDIGAHIEREPVKLSFKFGNAIKHCYPDFLIDGELVEIKGNQFIDCGKMICPYDSSKDDLYEAKHQCMLDNGVKFWYKEECSKYMDYVSDKYGSDYIVNFKI